MREYSRKKPRDIRLFNVKTKTTASPKRTGGRPPKFNEPSRPVTLTLPESTLRELEQIHPDRAQAIVKLTKKALRSDGSARPQVEVVEMSAGTGIIVVGPSPTLARIPFLHLVEVAPARFLMALDSGHDFKSLELAILDVLDDVPGPDKRERELIGSLLENIRNLRKNDRVSMAEVLLVRMDAKRRK